MNLHKVNYMHTYVLIPSTHTEKFQLPPILAGKLISKETPENQLPQAFNPWVCSGSLTHNQLNTMKLVPVSRPRLQKTGSFHFLYLETLTCRALNHHVRRPTLPHHLQLFQPPTIWSITDESPSNMEQRCIIPPVPWIPDPQNHWYSNTNKML